MIHRVLIREFWRGKNRKEENSIYLFQLSQVDVLQTLMHSMQSAR